MVANHFQVVLAGRERESERDRSRRAGRTLESLSALPHLFEDLVQDGDLSDVIEADGGVVVPQAGGAA